MIQKLLVPKLQMYERLFSTFNYNKYALTNKNFPAAPPHPPPPPGSKIFPLPPLLPENST